MRRSGTYWIVFVIGLAGLLILPVAVLFALPTSPTAPLSTPAPRLRLSVALGAEIVDPGAVIDVGVRVENVGNATAYLVFPSACQAGLRISDSEGSVLYISGIHAICLPTVTNLVLDPGASEEYEFGWDQTTDDGFPAPSARWYVIEGVLLTTTTVPVNSDHASVYIRGSGAAMDLALAAQLDRATYAPGDRANVTLSLTNIGVATVSIQFGTPCFLQFLVLDPSARELFNSSKHTACVQVMTSVILEPGASRSFTLHWDLTDDTGTPLSAGLEYRVVPSFVAGEAQYQAYVSRTEVATFTIVAPAAQSGA